MVKLEKAPPENISYRPNKEFDWVICLIKSVLIHGIGITDPNLKMRTIKRVNPIFFLISLVPIALFIFFIILLKILSLVSFMSLLYIKIALLSSYKWGIYIVILFYIINFSLYFISQICYNNRVQNFSNELFSMKGCDYIEVR